jgi:hypothetical protein
LALGSVNVVLISSLTSFMIIGNSWKISRFLFLYLCLWNS